MTDCDLRPGTVTYSKRWAMRQAAKMDDPPVIERCGDHYHVPDDAESLALRIRRAIGGRK